MSDSHQPGPSSVDRSSNSCASTAGAASGVSLPPRATPMKSSLLQQAVSDTAKRLSIAAASNGVSEKMLEESRKHTAELRAIKDEVSRLADAMQRQTEAFERQLKPVTYLVMLLASLISKSFPQD
ncbi:uncharacterized protein LOC119466247 [Dermacentor silvarum]|uniref:uncharacterized protein LOC119466247 n=1 Tax=Dermacentor silvarum TaxID=543639 RepID=UPI00189AC60A|nr:uncharacterized protein LOC119466247 [Dermacentor silvarum]